MNAPERIWAWLFMPEKQNEDMQGGWTDKPDRREAEYVRADLFAALEAEKAKAEAERDEARRRRDEWRKKAEGFDAVCKALREKVGAPWPPHLSRALWAGLAAAEKARADKAEALLAEAVEALSLYRIGCDWQSPPAHCDRPAYMCCKIAEAALTKIKEAKNG